METGTETLILEQLAAIDRKLVGRDKRLDAIEQKLDRLLALMGARQVDNRVEDFKTVLATGGVPALKNYVENMGKP